MLIDDLLYLLKQTGYTAFDSGEATYERLASSVRFQIDNVARYAYDSVVSVDREGQMKGDLKSYIPNTAPLALSMWFEFGGLAKNAGKPATNRYGCLISVEYDRKRQLDLLIPVYKDETISQRAEVPDDARWVLRCQGFANLPTGLVCMRWVPYISVTEDGSPDFYARQWAGHEPPTSRADIYNEIVVALLAICFAHCKGAVIEEHQPSRQVRRMAERKGEPTITFHTIDIEPSARILHTEGHISENGLARALHICRGHFAHYTAEKPLFGKYTGTFYRPMHVRGKAEHGVSVKDYRVHAPVDSKETQT